jgi:hypothetical protein
MGQPASIELRTGPDRAYRVAVVLLWLLAATSIVACIGELRWPWLVVAGVLLALLNPWFGDPGRSEGKLHIFRDGAAIATKLNGSWKVQATWKGHGWCNGWGTILRLEAPAGYGCARSSHVLVCASRNAAQDYRHLLVWSRFPPCGAGRGATDSKL